MKISIVGSGNAGCAHACILTEAGNEVTLIKTSFSLHDDNFEEISTSKVINYSNPNESTFKAVKIHKITRNIAEGVCDADVVMVMTQSLQHKNVAKLIGPYLNDPKLLIVIPGYLGSLYFREFIDENKTILAEGESTPYDARITKPGYVSILFKNARNAIGVLQEDKKTEAVQIMGELVDTYRHTRSNIVESALHNPNLIVHTIGAIMSASRIEYSKGEFWMYKEAFTPAIWNVIKQLDSEKNNVIELFGGIPSAYVDECKFRNEDNLQQNSMDVFNSYAQEGGPKGPESLDTRFIYEDVPNGLCLLENLAAVHGESTPITSSLINLANALHNVNYRTNSRTLECLQMTIEGLKSHC